MKGYDVKLRQLITTAVCTTALTVGLGTAASGTAVAHEPDRWVCLGNVSPFATMHSVLGDPTVDGLLSYGQHFAGHQTVVYGGQFWSYGHSSTSYPTDFWIRTNHLRC